MAGTGYRYRSPQLYCRFADAPPPACPSRRLARRHRHVIYRVKEASARSLAGLHCRPAIAFADDRLKKTPGKMSCHDYRRLIDWLFAARGPMPDYFFALFNAMPRCRRIRIRCASMADAAARAAFYSLRCWRQSGVAALHFYFRAHLMILRFVIRRSSMRASVAHLRLREGRFTGLTASPHATERILAIMRLMGDCALFHCSHRSMSLERRRNAPFSIYSGLLYLLILAWLNRRAGR